MKKNARVWCGMDVSKNSFDVGFLTDQPLGEFSKVATKTFPRTLKGVRSFRNWVGKRVEKLGVEISEVGILMEATNWYSTELADWLLEVGDWERVCVENPYHASCFHKSLGLRSKTDKIDARALAFYGRERTPKAYEPMPTHYRKLRELARARASLVKHQTAVGLTSKDCRDVDAKEILEQSKAQLAEGIKALEKKIAELIGQHQDLASLFALLLTIPGVGTVTASVVLAELGDLRHYDTGRQLVSKAGLAPKLVESGTSIRKRATISRTGSPLVRAMLYIAALTTLRLKDSRSAQSYRQMVARGKHPKVALCAVMRKTLVIMRAMAISGRPYDPELAYASGEARNHKSRDGRRGQRMQPA